jgi:hypothetical protein
MDKNHTLIQLSESKRTSFSKGDFLRQSLPQKVFSAIWAVQSEVCNGGFSQYFLNCSAETASFVVEALETIGASKTAVICQRAIASAFPGGLPTSPETISSGAANFSDETLGKLDAIDRDFFATSDNFTDLLFAYVSEHSEDFGTLPKPDDA